MKSNYGGKASFVASTTSNEVDVRNRSIVGLILPVGFVGTAITVQASKSAGGTYYPIYDDLGAAISFAVAGNRCVVLDARVTFSFGNYIKLVSSAVETIDVELIADVV